MVGGWGESLTYVFEPIQDNYNDVLSNGAALISALLAVKNTAWWWCDPVGAILISVYIIRAWLLTALEQVEMVVGKEADPEFVERVQEISRNHSELMKLDTVCALACGLRVNSFCLHVTSCNTCKFAYMQSGITSKF